MNIKVSLQSKAIAHYVPPERSISSTDLSCMFISLEHLHRWLGGVCQRWKPRGLAGFRAHRRRGNGQGSPVHAKYSPAAATLPRPILHGKQEDSRIYLAFKNFANDGREEEACAQGCGGRRPCVTWCQRQEFLQG